jgi:hypothetical protein
MPTSSLIVPTIFPTGSLRFAEVQQNATAKDVIEALIALDGVKSEILGDLADQGWALQTIRAERPGRPWEDAELEALGDGQYRLFQLQSQCIRLNFAFRNSTADNPRCAACRCHDRQSTCRSRFLIFPSDLAYAQPCAPFGIPQPGVLRFVLVSAPMGDSRRLRV